MTVRPIVTASTDHDIQAAALVALRDQIDAVNHTNARLAQADSLTGRNLEHVMALSRDLEAACEAFRRAHYPRRHKVVVALGSVCVLSVKGRHSEIVWERS